MEQENALQGRILQGRFRLQKVAGTGGFARIYQAEDLLLETPVAIKEFCSENLGADGETEQVGKKLLLKEARTLSQFQDLDGIAHIRDFLKKMIRSTW